LIKDRKVKQAKTITIKDSESELDRRDKKIVVVKKQAKRKVIVHSDDDD